MTLIDPRITAALVASLYAEALVLADEARAWFDRALVNRHHRSASDLSSLPQSAGVSGAAAGHADDEDELFRWAGYHDPSLRIALSCESLRLTTRLMHVIAWLLFQRAIMAGEVAAQSARLPANRLGEAPATDDALLARLPGEARRLVSASERLYARVAQLDAAHDKQTSTANPVGSLLTHLKSAL